MSAEAWQHQLEFEANLAEQFQWTSKSRVKTCLEQWQTLYKRYQTILSVNQHLVNAPIFEVL